jgi:two-component system response regulator RegX3
MPTVLMVDDEQFLLESLSFTLRKAGYEVLCASDGKTALEMAESHNPDMVLLDVMLPEVDGIEVCRRLRDRSDVPILMLTAKDHESDRIVGLEMGADDYISKPFSTHELLARMKAVARRYDAHGLTRARALQGGPVSMDLDRHEVTVRGERVNLSRREFRLLQVLLANAGRVVPREELIERVWGDEFMGDHKTVDVHIRWLREKLEADPSRPAHILNVRGVGYRFER